MENIVWKKGNSGNKEATCDVQKKRKMANHRTLKRTYDITA